MWKMAVLKPRLFRVDLSELWLFEKVERRAAPSRIRQLVAAADGEGLTRTTIVEMVAKELYDDELANGGWCLDLGVWGPSLYAQEASRLVAGLLGSKDEETQAQAV